MDVAFDDLSRLKGKKVLLVEDDVRSGATLKKLLAAIKIKPNRPKSLGLFLGSASWVQIQENIPPDFKKTYISDSKPDQEVRAFLQHLLKREAVFKDKPPAWLKMGDLR